MKSDCIHDFPLHRQRNSLHTLSKLERFLYLETFMPTKARISRPRKLFPAHIFKVEKEKRKDVI